MNAERRDAVTIAADEIDSLLRSMPLDVGESRADPHRVVCVRPLIAGYRESEAARLVTVVRVKAID